MKESTGGDLEIRGLSVRRVFTVDTEATKDTRRKQQGRVGTEERAGSRRHRHNGPAREPGAEAADADGSTVSRTTPRG